MDVTIIYNQERENLIIPSLPYQSCREIFEWWTMENDQNEKEYQTHNVDENEIKIKLVRDNILDIIMFIDENEIEIRKNVLKKAKEKRDNTLS